MDGKKEVARARENGVIATLWNFKRALRELSSPILPSMCLVFIVGNINTTKNHINANSSNEKTKLVVFELSWPGKRKLYVHIYESMVDKKYK